MAKSQFTGKVTRFEVIGDGGRIYTGLNLASVELSYQDDGRTLKVFITGDRSRPAWEEQQASDARLTPVAEGKATGSATLSSSSDLLAALTGMREAHDALRSALKKIPAKGVNRTYFASRYDTDDEHVLHVWGLGVDCFDLRIPKAELSAALDGCPVLPKEKERKI